MKRKIKSLLLSSALIVFMGVESFADTDTTLILPSQLKSYIDKADDYTIFANKVTTGADMEGNIAAKEAIITNNFGLPLNKVHNGVNIDGNRFNYIEDITPSNSAFRDGTVLFLDVDSKDDNGNPLNILSTTDGGTSWVIDDKKVGKIAKENQPGVTLYKIAKGESGNSIDISGELTGNLTNASKELAKLTEDNTSKFKVYNVSATDAENNNKKIELVSGDTDTIKNNIIVNINAAGDDILDIKADFTVNGVQADWNDIANKVIFNIHSNESVYTGTVNTHKLLMGTILAPQAKVKPIAGNVNGAIFCNEYLANSCEVHAVPFKVSYKGGIPTTPVTPSLPQLPTDTILPETGDTSILPVIGASVVSGTVLIGAIYFNRKRD